MNDDAPIRQADGPLTPRDDVKNGPPRAAAAMTEQEIFARLRPLITEVTGVGEDRIRMDSVLMADLGAESLDLLDLSFLIEEHFDVAIESDEFEGQARRRIPDGVYEKDGYLTPAALAELRKALPEVASSHLAEGLRKMELPSVLPVSVFVHLIQRKLAARALDTGAGAEGRAVGEGGGHDAADA